MPVVPLFCGDFSLLYKVLVCYQSQYCPFSVLSWSGLGQSLGQHYHSCKPNTTCIMVGRWDSLPAERLPGMHSLLAAEWRHPGPGGKGQDHPGGPTWVPGPLQQLRLPLSEPGCVCGAGKRLLLRLPAIGLHRLLLSQRYSTINPLWHLHACKHTDVNMQTFFVLYFTLRSQKFAQVHCFLTGLSKTFSSTSKVNTYNATSSRQIQLHWRDLHNEENKPSKEIDE